MAASLPRVRRPGAEWLVAGMAAALLVAWPILLRVRPLPRLIPHGVPRWPGVRSVPPGRAAALVHGVAARLPWPPGCLARALTEAWVLASTGARGRLVIGVTPPGAPFDAHAWFEVQGGPSPLPRPDPWCPVVSWPIPVPRSRT